MSNLQKAKIHVKNALAYMQKAKKETIDNENILHTIQDITELLTVADHHISQIIPSDDTFSIPVWDGHTYICSHPCGDHCPGEHDVPHELQMGCSCSNVCPPCKPFIMYI